MPNWFDVCQGLQQGCNLAILLFNLYFAVILMVPIDELAKDGEVRANMMNVERQAR